MADNPYGEYGASRSEPDWRANSGRGRIAEQWGSYEGDHPNHPGNRNGEQRSFGPRERDEEARRQRGGPRGRGAYEEEYGIRDSRNANARYLEEPYPEYSDAEARPFDQPHYDRSAYDRSAYEREPYSRGYERNAEADDAALHRGKGPKGYRRSDERIREDVSDRMMDDGALDASNIEVRVENSEVTLDGTVDSRADKRRAEVLAEHCSGVDHVQNNLRVKRRDAVDHAAQPSAGLAGENQFLDRVADGRNHLRAD